MAKTFQNRWLTRWFQCVVVFCFFLFIYLSDHIPLRWLFYFLFLCDRFSFDVIVKYFGFLIRIGHQTHLFEKNKKQWNSFLLFSLDFLPNVFYYLNVKRDERVSYRQIESKLKKKASSFSSREWHRAQVKILGKTFVFIDSNERNDWMLVYYHAWLTVASPALSVLFVSFHWI